MRSSFLNSLIVVFSSITTISIPAISCIIFPIFCSQVVREASSGEYHLPESMQLHLLRGSASESTSALATRKFGQRFRFDTFYFVYNQAETVTQVNDSSGYALHLRLLVNTRRAVSAIAIPMLRRCTSSFGFAWQQSADKLPACEPGG